MLYHISEESDIFRFEPRSGPTADQPVIWAVSAERMRNYLLPRDCPRVTFFAGDRTTAADRDRLLGPSEAVVAMIKSADSHWGEFFILGEEWSLYEENVPGENFSGVEIDTVLAAGPKGRVSYGR